MSGSRKSEMVCMLDLQIETKHLQLALCVAQCVYMLLQQRLVVKLMG